MRANKKNKEYFEEIRKSLEEKNKKSIDHAKDISEKINNKGIVFIRQCSESGQLYGSVTPKDIANHLKEDNILVSPSNINLHSAIKKIGIYNVGIKLHAEVSINLKLNVASTDEQASIQFKKQNNEQETKNITKKKVKEDSINKLAEKSNNTSSSEKNIVEEKE